MNRTYLRQMLLSSNKLLITAEGYTAAMMEYFPLTSLDKQTASSFFFETDPPSYKDVSKKALTQILQTVKASSELKSITLTDDFSSQDIPENTIAYHRIFGMITSSSRWYFSSKQFEQDLILAESNPSISCHFFHINSPGGEAWYLDRLSETILNLQKPIIALIEQTCASAAYYIACNSKHIYALTLNDKIGCIGTMVDFLDFEGYYEKLGIKRVSAKASQSDLKNKKYEDLKKGKPKQYIEEELNPLSEQFIFAVRQGREKLRTLPDDSPIFRGETFSTAPSIASGLIDGQLTLAQAIEEASRLGKEYSEAVNIKKRALTYI